MGIKVNPIGFRIGINKNWRSRWYTSDKKLTTKWLVEDKKIHDTIIKKYPTAQIDRIEIERTCATNTKQASIIVFIYTGQGALLIGKDGTNIPVLTLLVNKIVGRDTKVNIQIVQAKAIEWSARVIAREIADQIENRVSFRTAQKAAIKKVMRSGAIGIKTKVSGRLGGVEMARAEGYTEGIVSLSTIRADLDYANEVAQTPVGGSLGVKVWINRGEIIKKGLDNQVIPPDREDRSVKRKPYRRGMEG